MTGKKVSEVAKVQEVRKVQEIQKEQDVRQVQEVQEVPKVKEGLFSINRKAGADSANIAFKPFENSVYDLRGLVRVLDDLELIERALFRGKEGTISQKARDFTTSSTLALFEEIEKTALEPTSDRDQLSFLKDLELYLRRLPIVKLTLAFGPTNTFVERISNSVSAVVGKKTLLDVVVNEYIVGGAIFEYKGKISKQTLDGHLDEVLGRLVGAVGSVSR